MNTQKLHPLLLEAVVRGSVAAANNACMREQRPVSVLPCGPAFRGATCHYTPQAEASQ